VHLHMRMQVFKWLVSTQDICIETPEVDDTTEESTCANRKTFLTYNF